MKKEIISNADIIVQLTLLSDDKNSLLRENQTLIGVLNPYDNKDKINNVSNLKPIWYIKKLIKHAHAWKKKELTAKKWALLKDFRMEIIDIPKETKNSQK